jgi:hypothetical protein
VAVFMVAWLIEAMGDLTSGFSGTEKLS